MKIVIPMAGAGQRFVKAGYTIPKPLIPVKGTPMYALAVDSLPVELCSQIIFLVREEHLDGALERDIERRYQNYNPTIVPVAKLTEGQMCTVMLASEFIDSDEGVLIHNADTAFKSELGKMLKLDQDQMDGILSVFESTEPRFSYARTDSSGKVLEVKEKQVISPWATTGMYYFGSGKSFMQYADEAQRTNLRYNGEFYIGPLYNLVIRDGGKVILDHCSEVRCMGTPEELNEVLARD